MNETLIGNAMEAVFKVAEENGFKPDALTNWNDDLLVLTVEVCMGQDNATAHFFNDKDQWLAVSIYKGEISPCEGPEDVQEAVRAAIKKAEAEYMETITNHIKRIIDREIYVNASTMVTDLEGIESVKPNTYENLLPCLSRDDWETPVRYEIINNAYVSDLVDVAEMCDTELTNEAGVVIDHDNAIDFKLCDVNTTALLDFVEEGDMWQEVAELLDVEPDTIEALQHWLVSDWLADKLQRVGALIAEDVLGFNVWGRTDCGQSLEYNSDLNKVAELIERRTAI